MSDRNPNRDLPADQVVHLFAKNLPELVENLGADREWLWFVSDGKPSEDVRTTLKELGFCFTPAAHPLPDGRTAHWYHSCGGAVFRRRRAHTEQVERKPARKYKAAKNPAPRSRVAESSNINSDALAQLEQLAAILPT